MSATALTRWWRTRPKAVRWGIGIAAVAVFYLLPVLKPPLLSTPDTDFGGVLFITVGTYVAGRLGLNIVVGRPACSTSATSASSPSAPTPPALLSAQHATLPWLATIPIAIVVRHLAGLLLGAPTLRLRGDYLAIVTLGLRRDHPHHGPQRARGWARPRGINDIPKPPQCSAP